MIILLADGCGAEIPIAVRTPTKAFQPSFLSFQNLPKMFRADDNNTVPWVSKARSALAMVTMLTAFVMMMPAAFAHNAAPNFFFSTFIFIMTTMMSGHNNPCDVRHNMPAHIAARYDAGAWAAGILSYLVLRFTGATVIQGFLVFIVWNVLTYLHYCHLESIYGRDAVWARKNPEQAARIAADKARADEAYKQTQEYKDWEGFKFAMIALVTSFITFLFFIAAKKPIAAA